MECGALPRPARVDPDEAVGAGLEALLDEDLGDAPT